MCFANVRLEGDLLVVKGPRKESTASGFRVCLHSANGLTKACSGQERAGSRRMNLNVIGGSLLPLMLVVRRAREP
jgi:hypothetical protein